MSAILMKRIVPVSTTVFAPRILMQSLFTPQEQLAFASNPMGILFIGYLAATPSIDITDAVFIDDINQAVGYNLLTQARATQVLAGVLINETATS